MDWESKVIGFQFELARTVSNHEEFYQDISDEGNAMEQAVGKITRLAFDASADIPSQSKHKIHICAVTKWRLFANLIFRVYLSWIK